MNQISKYLVPFVSGVMFLSLSTYAATFSNRKTDSAAGVTVNTALKTSPTSTLISQKTVTVTIYRPDSQCEALVPQKVTVSGESLVEAAVGKVLEQRSNDFNLTGYRVSINLKSGVATVDMRLAPNSKRKFVSLSTCEQFALFGSLRKTLTSNQGFNVKNVRFTEQGAEINL